MRAAKVSDESRGLATSAIYYSLHTMRYLPESRRHILFIAFVLIRHII